MESSTSRQCFSWIKHIISDCFILLSRSISNVSFSVLCYSSIHPTFHNAQGFELHPYFSITCNLVVQDKEPSLCPDQMSKNGVISGGCQKNLNKGTFHDLEKPFHFISAISSQRTTRNVTFRTFCVIWKSSNRNPSIASRPNVITSHDDPPNIGRPPAIPHLCIHLPNLPISSLRRSRPLLPNYHHLPLGPLPRFRDSA